MQCKQCGYELAEGLERDGSYLVLCDACGFVFGTGPEAKRVIDRQIEIGKADRVEVEAIGAPAGTEVYAMKLRLEAAN